MRILFLTSAHNSLSQRLWIELGELGHQIRVCVAATDEAMIAAVSREVPDLIIAPILKIAIPEQVWYEAPEAPAVPVSELGDVWLLGRHRLVCGDCTDRAVVEKALNGVNPHLMVTDPPYGVEYDANWRSGSNVSASLRHPLKGAVGQIKIDFKSDWREAWVLFPGDVAYCCHADRHASNTQLAFES